MHSLDVLLHFTRCFKVVTTYFTFVWLDFQVDALNMAHQAAPVRKGLFAMHAIQILLLAVHGFLVHFKMGLLRGSVGALIAGVPLLL